LFVFSGEGRRLIVKKMDAKSLKIKQALRTRIQAYLNEVPDSYCLDLINVIVCCRYVESLLANPRVKRYLARYHPEQLIEMEKLLLECR
jgi:hypothetical protein